MSISRRDFLKGAAASAAAMGLGSIGLNSEAKAEAAAPQVLTADSYQNMKWAFEVMPAEYPIAEEKISKTITHDIIVVGSGLSGLTTAVSA